jgi:hypothetical protein
VQTAEGKLYLFVGIDRTSKFAVTQLVDKADRRTAWEFLEHLLKAVPSRIHTILTDNDPLHETRPVHDGMTADLPGTGRDDVDGCQQTSLIVGRHAAGQRRMVRLRPRPHKRKRVRVLREKTRRIVTEESDRRVGGRSVQTHCVKLLEKGDLLHQQSEGLHDRCGLRPVQGFRECGHVTFSEKLVEFGGMGVPQPVGVRRAYTLDVGVLRYPVADCRAGRSDRPGPTRDDVFRRHLLPRDVIEHETHLDVAGNAPDFAGYRFARKDVGGNQRSS